MVRALRLVPLLAAFSHAVEIPFNIGVGPTLHYLPGPLEKDGPLYYGFSTDLYAAISHELLMQHIANVPKKFRRYAKATHDIHYKPGVLGWLPAQFIIHPEARGTSIYGGTLSLITLGSALGKSEVLQPTLAVKLPTVTYMYM